MLRRFVMIVLVGLLAEAAVFALAYDDLLALRYTGASVESDFIQRADRVLSRRKVTRAHLEAIASQAQSLGLAAIEVRALDACASLSPHDAPLTHSPSRCSWRCRRWRPRRTTSRPRP